MNKSGSWRAFWKDYLSQLPSGHPHRDANPDAFAFGSVGALADELAALVLSGKKRATTSLAIEFTSVDEPLPQVGSLSIILRGDLTPVAIIERTDVRTVLFDEVDEAYAATEGEGDGSLVYWRAAHTEYFTGVCERLGARFDHKTPVICQIFRVVWPPSNR
ncbi:MAG: ASCH domain-containing protein [Sulfurifustis sp.]